MKKIDKLFQNFIKGSRVSVLRTDKNCVIYTRVSSKEQADNNTSLASQKRYCEEYCQKHGYSTEAYFGGTYESAKGDERKEFKRMLEYVRKNKNIDTILVYSYDRFSRSGANAAFLSQELQKIGVKVNAVSQQIDTSSPSGRLHRDMLYLFSQFDNELRRDKVVNGMIENLRQGYWVAATPFGYTNLNRKEKAKNHKYEINKDGELLKEGFKLKAEGSLTNKEIVAKLRRKGCKINYKSFVRIISNPFYCGYITHTLIPGEICRGHHPALVSEELFFAANRIIADEPRSGIAKQHKIDDLPLKIFASCDNSETPDMAESPLTGYIQKGIYYYKSRKKGTAINVNAKHLNGLFIEELRKYEYNKKHSQKLREKISQLINEKLKDHLQEQIQSKKELTELNGKIERLEERFIEGQLTRELFEKYQSKFKAESIALEQKLAAQPFESSNLEKIIDKGIAIAENLSAIWLSGDFDGKQKLQYLVFPEGILYNKQKDTVRTPRVNSLFAPIPHLVSVLGKDEKSHPVKNGSKSHLVVPTGIEPVSKV
jgi:site-specific DNA recombinase